MQQTHSKDQTSSIADLSTEDYNKLMEFAVRIHNDLRVCESQRSPNTNAAKTFTVYSVLAHIQSGKVIRKNTVTDDSLQHSEIGGLVGGTDTPDGLHLAGIREIVGGLRPGNSCALTIHGHTVAFGCEFGGSGPEPATAQAQLWFCDSLEGKFLMRSDSSNARFVLSEHICRGSSLAEQFSGIMFA
jgi:hypothetical protein